MIFLFKRNKKTGRKTRLGTVETETQARASCIESARHDYTAWFEYTSDPEQLRNTVHKAVQQRGSNGA